MGFFHYHVLPVMINQCTSARRVYVEVPDKPHFGFVIKFLDKMGYINSSHKPNDKNIWVIFPRYNEDRTPVLNGFRVVSTPGNRTYITLREIASIVNDSRRSRVHHILSTRKGLMTLRDAYRQRIGGEIMYEIW